MGFWSLFEVASMPILQVLIISGLGAFMATGYINILTADARRSLNKVCCCYIISLGSKICQLIIYVKKEPTQSKV